MFFHLRVFSHSVLFFLLLEAVMHESVSEFLSSLMSGNIFFLLLIVFAYASLIVFSGLKIGQKWSMLPIPVVLALSSVGLLAFIDSDAKKFAFSVLASVVYYFCLLAMYRFKSCHKDQTARGMIAATAVATIFLFYSSAYGVYLNFSIPLWVAMLFFLLPTTLISYQYFRLIEEDSRKVWVYSLVIGLAMTEISWVLNFWPFGYLTTGVTMLIFYYVLWDLVQSHFLKMLSKSRVVTNIVFFGILATMVLVSSRWLPVV